MFAKTIDVIVTRKEILFRSGMKEVSFRPVVFLSSDKKVLALGEAPTEGVADLEVHVFENTKVDDVFPLIEAMMCYGVRKMIGSFFIGLITLKISIGADIRADLKGFAPAIFRYAAINAGASKIVLS